MCLDAFSKTIINILSMQYVKLNVAELIDESECILISFHNNFARVHRLK